MEIARVKSGMSVIVNKAKSPYDGQEGKVLTTHYDLSGEECIRLYMEESCDVVSGYKAVELVP